MACDSISSSYQSLLGKRAVQDWAWAMGIVLVFLSIGCVAGGKKPTLLVHSNELPSSEYFEREQLRIHSDFEIPQRHRLIDDMTAIRRDLCQRLLLPISDEPILVYIFKDADRFRKYMEETLPTFPDRRAFFVQTDTELKVFAHWGDRVGEDLRHEVTHGYVHAVVPNTPLWLDEGLAEFFEVPRARHGFHREHIYFLLDQVSEGWRPDMQRLEGLEQGGDMTQADYAESWLWTHFLLETDESHRKLLQDQMARHRMVEELQPLSQYLEAGDSEIGKRLLEHLADLAQKL